MSLIKPHFRFAGFMHLNFMFLTSLSSAEKLAQVECSVLCKCKSKSGLGGAFLLSHVHKVREGVLTTACFDGGLETKLACFLKYTFYLKVT